MCRRKVCERQCNVATISLALLSIIRGHHLVPGNFGLDMVGKSGIAGGFVALFNGSDRGRTPLKIGKAGSNVVSRHFLARSICSRSKSISSIEEAGSVVQSVLSDEKETSTKSSA